MPLHSQQVDSHERLFFDYGLAFNGPASYEALSEVAVKMDRRTAQALETDLRLLLHYLQAHLACLSVPPVPLADLLLANQMPGVETDTPFFSGRFDIVQDEAGNGYVIELNADRNGLQRESMADPVSGEQFRDRYLDAIRHAWLRFGDSERIPNVAIMIAPAYREESSLAPFLALTIQTGLGWPCQVVGIDNLVVTDVQTVMAFGRPVDLIIRQYPTEYLYESAQGAAIAKAYLNGRVLVLNSFRALILQAKNWMADITHRCWYQPETLDADYVMVFRRILPFTATLMASVLPVDPANPLGEQYPTRAALHAHPDRWVLKPALGRYSWGVTCGATATPDEWHDAIRFALARPQYWIAQRFIAPRNEQLWRWRNGESTSVPGYVNYGVHLLDGQLAGWTARCSTSQVTDDAWFSRVELTD